MFLSFTTVVSIIAALIMSAIPQPTAESGPTINDLVRRGVESVSIQPTRPSSELPEFDLEAQLDALAGSVSTAKASDTVALAIEHYVSSDGIDWAGNKSFGWVQCSWTRTGEPRYVGEPGRVQVWNEFHLDKLAVFRQACAGQPDTFAAIVQPATAFDGRPGVSIMDTIYPCNELFVLGGTIGIGAEARMEANRICGLN